MVLPAIFIPSATEPLTHSWVQGIRPWTSLGSPLFRLPCPQVYSGPPQHPTLLQGHHCSPQLRQIQKPPQSCQAQAGSGQGQGTQWCLSRERPSTRCPLGQGPGSPWCCSYCPCMADIASGGTFRWGLRGQGKWPCQGLGWPTARREGGCREEHGLTTGRGCGYKLELLLASLVSREQSCPEGV